MPFGPQPFSLITRVLLLSLLLGGSLWGALDWIQRRELKADFLSQLQEQLEYEASIDRQLFDRHVQGLHQSARLVASQKTMHDYLRSPAWAASRAAQGVRNHFRPPPWLPPSSTLRSFYHAHDALLLGPDGRVQEVYHNRYQEEGEPLLPPSLVQPSTLLRKLSHSQAYMTLLDGLPHVITTEEIADERGRLLAILLLCTPIDDDFLAQAKESSGTKSILTLLDPQADRILASSDVRTLTPGKPVASLQRDFLMIGKSFFDYGSSDLELQFASFIATARTQQVVQQLLARESQRRGILALILISFFSLLTLSIALRVRRLNHVVKQLSYEHLGITTHRGRGDEIRQLENQFKDLSEELDRAQHENVSLHGRIVDSENQLRSLRVVTELLSVGVIIDSTQGVKSYNRLMDALVADFGGCEPFLLGEGQHSVELRLPDRSGHTRFFSLEHHDSLGPRGVLVRETTHQRRLEEERDFFANIPAFTPNPIARIDRKGDLLYGNVPMYELVERLNPQQPRRIPDPWLRRLDQHLSKGMDADFEIRDGERTYAFVVGLLGEQDTLYLFGQDVTDKRRAEHELRLAATVTRNVLDGILITDTQGIIQQLNPAFSTMFGYREGELAGYHLEQVLVPEERERLKKEIWLAIARDGFWQGEITNRSRDGRNLFCLARISAIYDEGQEPSNYVVLFSDITERKRHEERLAQMAFYDALTGLPNRSLLEDRLRQSMAVAQRSKHPLAVLYLDLDGFKPVNDRFGHHVGDQLLCVVAERLRECVRNSDTVSRVGGDEFVIVLSDMSGEGFAKRIAQKVLEVIRTPVELAGTSVSVSASIGIAYYPEDGASVEELLLSADQAMYDIKHGGKNAYGGC